MGSWNSILLEIAYQVLGWVAFTSWSFSLYPQAILNFRRKSVVGLNFDFLVLNLTKHSSYLIYNASLFFSPVVQGQYHEKYGFGDMIPVAANDVALSMHAVLLLTCMLCQVLIYEVSFLYPLITWKSEGVQDMHCYNVYCMGFCCSLCFHSFTKPFLALANLYIQVVMNFGRKSTVGWSIVYILLDILGGVANYSQMVRQSLGRGSWVNLYGNIGKTLFSLVTIFYDLIFLFQHYVLYPSKKEKVLTKVDNEITDPLMTSFGVSQSEHE
ncbi:hypothetical protein GIB67_004417 [Kingdonia uniflora]|uniref:Cystinosin homolog n=1 Tax=Kingdonia uniflora TaxID=39325 RepID=A0A7J7MRC3_9MAGN|nr:hypothetical protein GIB67_004417 [Kingdonia uniflora]